MITQARELAEALERDGWRIVERSDDLPWWGDEQWTLESTWSPVGFGAVITFLVDPQHADPRPKGEGVWSVRASTGRAEESEGLTVQIRHRWAEGLAELVEHLRTLRSR